MPRTILRSFVLEETVAHVTAALIRRGWVYKTAARYAVDVGIEVERELNRRFSDDGELIEDVPNA